MLQHTSKMFKCKQTVPDGAEQERGEGVQEIKFESRNVSQFGKRDPINIAVTLALREQKNVKNIPPHKTPNGSLSPETNNPS